MIIRAVDRYSGTDVTTEYEIDREFENMSWSFGGIDEVVEHLVDSRRSLNERILTNYGGPSKGGVELEEDGRVVSYVSRPLTQEEFSGIFEKASRSR